MLVTNVKTYVSFWEINERRNTRPKYKTFVGQWKAVLEPRALELVSIGPPPDKLPPPLDSICPPLFRVFSVPSPPHLGAQFEFDIISLQFELDLTPPPSLEPWVCFPSNHDISGGSSIGLGMVNHSLFALAREGRKPSWQIGGGRTRWGRTESAKWKGDPVVHLRRAATPLRVEQPLFRVA